MQRLSKGCLLIFVVLFGLLILAVFAIYIYWKIPNKIEYVDKPIDKELYLTNLLFKNREIPPLILKQPEKNIIHQTYIEEESFF